MITQEELRNGLELVKNDGIFNLYHPIFKECAMVRIGTDLVMSMGAIVIYFDDVRLRNGILEFLKNNEVVTAVNPEQLIVDQTEVE